MNKATVLFYRGRTGLIPMRLPATTTAGVLGLDFAICMPAQHARLVYWNIFQETLSDTTVLLGCGFEVSGNHLEDKHACHPRILCPDRFSEFSSD